MPSNGYFHYVHLTRCPSRPNIGILLASNEHRMDFDDRKFKSTSNQWSHKAYAFTMVEVLDDLACPWGI